MLTSIKIESKNIKMFYNFTINTNIFYKEFSISVIKIYIHINKINIFRLYQIQLHINKHVKIKAKLVKLVSDTK